MYYKLFGTILLSGVSLIPPVLAAETVTPDWQMFHGNAQHTGYADVKGPRSGTLQWKIKAASGEDTSPPPNSIAVGGDGVVYIGSPTKVYAVKSSGKVKWSKRYSSVQGPALSADGKTVYMAGNNKLVALSTKNGERQWSVKMGNSTLFGPTVGPDGVIYQGSWDGYFYAVKPNGKLKWKYLTAGAVSYPASIGHNGVIYLGAGDAHAGSDPYVYAFKPDGTLKWQYDTGSERSGSPAIDADGLIYVASAPTLYVFNKDGTLAWAAGPNTGGGDEEGGGDEPPGGDDGEQTIQAADDIAGIITPAIAADGTIYIGNSEGIIYAIDPDSHETKWSYTTGPNSEGTYGLPSFPVVDKAGVVYFGAMDGKMYALKKDGTLLWSYETGAALAEAAPALGADGTLYFASDDGYVYAINE